MGSGRDRSPGAAGVSRRPLPPRPAACGAVTRCRANTRPASDTTATHNRPTADRATAEDVVKRRSTHTWESRYLGGVRPERIVKNARKKRRRARGGRK